MESVHQQLKDAIGQALQRKLEPIEKQIKEQSEGIEKFSSRLHLLTNTLARPKAQRIAKTSHPIIPGRRPRSSLGTNPPIKPKKPAPPLHISRAAVTSNLKKPGARVPPTRKRAGTTDTKDTKNLPGNMTPQAPTSESLDTSQDVMDMSYHTAMTLTRISSHEDFEQNLQDFEEQVDFGQLLGAKSPSLEGIEEKETPILEEVQGEEVHLGDVLKELDEISENYPEEELRKYPNFTLTLGTKTTLSCLNTLTDSQVYLTKPLPADTLWLLRVVYQLTGNPLPKEDEAALEVCRLFLAGGKELGLEERITETCRSFDFSNLNIDKVQSMVEGKLEKVNPKVYEKDCLLSSVLCLLLKEALAYAGCVPEKTQIWRRYQRLLYRKKVLEP